jgi:hypothetical protein
MGWHHACPCAMEPAQHKHTLESSGEDAGAGQVGVRTLHRASALGSKKRVTSRWGSYLMPGAGDL